MLPFSSFEELLKPKEHIDRLLPTIEWLFHTCFSFLGDIEFVSKNGNLIIKVNDDEDEFGKFTIDDINDSIVEINKRMVELSGNKIIANEVCRVCAIYNACFDFFNNNPEEKTITTLCTQYFIHNWDNDDCNVDESWLKRDKSIVEVKKTLTDDESALIHFCKEHFCCEENMIVNEDTFGVLEEFDEKTERIFYNDDIYYLIEYVFNQYLHFSKQPAGSRAPLSFYRVLIHSLGVVLVHNVSAFRDFDIVDWFKDALFDDSVIVEYNRFTRAVELSSVNGSEIKFKRDCFCRFYSFLSRNNVFRPYQDLFRSFSVPLTNSEIRYNQEKQKQGPRKPQEYHNRTRDLSEWHQARRSHQESVSSVRPAKIVRKAETAAEKVAEKAAEKAAEKPTKKSAGKSAGKSASKPAGAMQTFFKTFHC